MKLHAKLKNMTLARMDSKGRALLLGFTPINGDDITLEIERDGLNSILSALYLFAHKSAEALPPAHTLPDVPLASVLLLPAEEIEIRTTDTGAVWVLTRTGALDTAVALPDPRTAKALGESLLARGTR